MLKNKLTKAIEMILKKKKLEPAEWNINLDQYSEPQKRVTLGLVNVNIEKYYLACVIPYLGHWKDLLHFGFVNKKCFDTLLMVHINPLFPQPEPEYQNENTPIIMIDHTTEIVDLFYETFLLPNIQTFKIKSSQINEAESLMTKYDRIEVLPQAVSSIKYDYMDCSTYCTLNKNATKIVALDFLNCKPELFQLELFTNLQHLRNIPIDMRYGIFNTLKILKLAHFVSKDADCFDQILFERKTDTSFENLKLNLEDINFDKTRVIVTLNQMVEFNKLREECKKFVARLNVSVRELNFESMETENCVIQLKGVRVSPTDLESKLFQTFVDKYLPFDVTIDPLYRCKKSQFDFSNAAILKHLELTTTKDVLRFNLPTLIEDLHIPSSVCVSNFEKCHLTKLEITGTNVFPKTLPKSLKTLVLGESNAIYIRNFEDLEIEELKMEIYSDDYDLPKTLKRFALVGVYSDLPKLGELNSLTALTIIACINKPLQLPSNLVSANLDIRTSENIVFPTSLKYLDILGKRPDVCPNVESLKIYGENTSKVDFVKFFARCNNLKMLKMSNCAAVYQNLPSTLIELHINERKLKSVSIANLTSLKRLEMCFSDIGDMKLPTTIQVLVLEYTLELGVAGEKYFEHMDNVECYIGKESFRFTKEKMRLCRVNTKGLYSKYTTPNLEGVYNFGNGFAIFSFRFEDVGYDDSTSDQEHDQMERITRRRALMDRDPYSDFIVEEDNNEMANEDNRAVLFPQNTRPNNSTLGTNALLFQNSPIVIENNAQESIPDNNNIKSGQGNQDSPFEID
ncbi:hypothetical protein EIN_274920 [Entamoeba invadens IP1]|uniref:Leucine-rich repeat containing protein n=1 Tax=Entamoeba invadens IP1 TaxID=370355 RepID=A0A0A1U1K6_ENTIV|nr:hypothetical protein EIN_274920 [Entamoeba invadens IP1]ELP87905.1 hypothetical protein EIN_274920 [Entamoeba invadens IP1]|eukprot:XP_004254676.1 hypothetical protein EIN_274920 [Entamoeba invadens IP1]